MPRWEGDAAGRLERAALELFDERGFDRTTVAEIARRAGLNERSFYRYFADKREALFGGGDELQEQLSRALAEVPPGTGPLDTLLAALETAEQVFRPRGLLHIRARVISANPELRERELIKMESIVATFQAALRARGVDEATALVATDLAVTIWRVAGKRWGRDEEMTFAEQIKDAARDFRQVAAGGQVAAGDRAGTTATAAPTR